MTIEEAKTLKIGTYLSVEGQKDKYGNPRKWKVNGKVKTWKRNSERIEIPVKYDFIVLIMLQRKNYH